MPRSIMPMTEVQQKRKDWIEKVLKSGQRTSGRCDRCGSTFQGISNAIDLSFTCVFCRADELFPDPAELKKPFPVAELKYGGLVPLDVEDFAKV